MNKKTLVISLIAFFVLLFAFVVTKREVSAAMPDDQCYQIAINKDKALENMGGILQWTGNRINPCTGVSDSVETYYDLDGGVTQMRKVYGNGDVEGYLGLTRFLACQDGRAKVMQRIYGALSGQGYGVGFWDNFPFDDDPSTAVKEKEICNTL